MELKHKWRGNLGEITVDMMKKQGNILEIHSVEKESIKFINLENKYSNVL